MKIALSGSSGSIGSLIKPYLSKMHDVLPISFRPNKDNSKDINTLGSDALIHLASQNSSLRSNSDRKRELQIAKSALTFCIKNKIKSLIFFSSSQVYDSNNHSNEIFNESHKCSPRNLYSIAKIECEQYFIDECRRNKINLIILRLSPFVDLKSSSKIAFLGNLAKKFKIAIEFNNANLNKRSFLTAKNLFAVINESLNYLNLSNQIVFQTFNLADKKPISTNELVNVIVKKHSVKPFRIKVPMIFELITSKMPIVKNLYENLINNHAIDVSLVEETLKIRLLETHQSLSND